MDEFEKNKENYSSKEFKVCALTEQGCEEFLINELEQRFKIKSELKENWVIFNSRIDKIAEVMYLSQTLKRLILTIAEDEFSDLQDLGEKINKYLDLEDSISILRLVSNKTMRIMCERTGSHDFNSVDAEQEIMDVLRKKLSSKNLELKLNLNSPDMIFYLRIAENKFIFGLDCAGRELSKRQHLVFNNPNAIKGTIGFSALTYAGYKPGLLFIDPFSLSGNIVIEAALFESGLSVNYYTKKFSLLNIEILKDSVESVIKRIDSKAKAPLSKPEIISTDSLFNNVSAQKKNAKIAGVEKYISFSRTDVYNLDIKNFDSKIDVICSRIIEASNHFSESQARNIYSTMFRVLKYVLSKDAVLVFIVRNPELLELEAEKEGYKEEGLKQVWQGQQGYFFVKFRPGELKNNE